MDVFGLKSDQLATIRRVARQSWETAEMIPGVQVIEPASARSLEEPAAEAELSASAESDAPSSDED